MGSSGAGKTTLLNALVDRLYKNGLCRTKYRYSGKILVNKHIEVTQKNFGRFGAYVMQNDILFASLKCEEALMFAAKLRL